MDTLLIGVADDSALLCCFLNKRDAYMNDTKVWAETILPQPISVPTAKNGEIIISIGARFSTSDYGNGAADCLPHEISGKLMNRVKIG